MRARGRIFLLDDDDLIVDMLGRALKGENYEVLSETDPEGALDKIRSFSPDVVMLDIKLPGKSGIDLLQELIRQEIAAQVVMLTSDDRAATAVQAMKLGAVDYLTKPFDLDEVKIVIRNLIERGNLKQEVDYLRKVHSEVLHGDIIGASREIGKLKDKAAKLAEAGVPLVLITGESGTGKEVFARFIHRVMHRQDSLGYAPFIGINCAALPEPLIESELFGYEKGAFTDAKTDKKGVFELAYGGSILLDEIGEMKQNLQTKLLRVLEERKVRRIGGRQDIPVDATILATTNRDLPEAVKRDEFRMDLLYRLNTFSLNVPPLRERKEDIPFLARHFLDHFSTRYGRKTLKDISPEADALLSSYRWPGNVRELRNVIERIVVLENGDRILPEHLPKELLQAESAAGASSDPAFTLPDAGMSLDDLERNLIRQALGKAGNNKTVAAKLLGMTYDSLRYQIKKFGLE